MKRNVGGEKRTIRVPHPSLFHRQPMHPVRGRTPFTRLRFEGTSENARSLFPERVHAFPVGAKYTVHSEQSKGGRVELPGNFGAVYHVAVAPSIARTDEGALHLVMSTIIGDRADMPDVNPDRKSGTPEPGVAVPFPFSDTGKRSAIE